MSSKIETRNGRFVDPLAPNPDDIVIEDIAHALSMICRFGGYTARHFGVAEHSVNVAKTVSRMLGDAGAGYHPSSNKIIVRQALLHDATEAYLHDLPKPLKNAMPAYENNEKALWRIIAEKFEVPYELHPFIKEADGRMCSTEKLKLLSADGLDRPEWAIFKSHPPFVGDWDIVEGDSPFPPSPGLIRWRFLDLYEQVKP